MPDIEPKALIRVSALDGVSHPVNINHETSFGASTVQIYQLLSGLLRRRTFKVGVGYDNVEARGYQLFGPARRHDLEIQMFGVAIDGIHLSSDELELDALPLEWGRFEDPNGNFPDCDRRLIVPLRAGQLTLGFSEEELPTAS